MSNVVKRALAMCECFICSCLIDKADGVFILDAVEVGNKVPPQSTLKSTQSTHSAQRNSQLFVFGNRV
jgi:hypothetical protein